MAFLGLSAILTVTPGADMALISRSVLAGGRAPAFAATLGIAVGLVVHACLSALGLSVILARSATLFEAVRLLGAAYLVVLGLHTLLAARPAVAVGPRETKPGQRRLGAAFLHGLATNLLNPKVALFYLTLLPQFIRPDDVVLRRSLLLASIHIVLGVVWLTLYAHLIRRLAAALGRPSVRRWLERATGAMLVGLGLRVAWERR